MVSKNYKIKFIEFTLNYGWAFLALMFAIMFLVVFWDFDNFTIYKNECFNDSINIVETHDCWMGCINISFDMLYKCGNEKTGFYLVGDIIDYCDKMCGRIEKEVCNPIEVDEIEIGEKFIGNSYLIDCKGYCIFSDEVPDNFSGFVIPKNRSEYEKDRVPVTILKKEITNGWLDEKCECISWIEATPKEYQNCMGKTEISTDLGTANYYCNKGKCSKYSCFENYEVEIQ